MLRIVIALAGLFLAPAAMAGVHEQSEQGFVIRHGADVPASPEETWDMLVRPAQWWSPAHTFSRDAANLSLHPRAGGCFCEILPNETSPRAAPRGSVEHMRVIYAEDGRALRMTGGLGPLQASAAGATLTIFLRPTEGGTRILWEYVVSGYLRRDDMAAVVDQLLGEQIARLAGALRGKALAEGAPPSGSEPAPERDEFGEAFGGEALKAADTPADPEPRPVPAVPDRAEPATDHPEMIGR